MKFEDDALVKMYRPEEITKNLLKISNTLFYAEREEAQYNYKNS